MLNFIFSAWNALDNAHKENGSLDLALFFSQKVDFIFGIALGTRPYVQHTITDREGYKIIEEMADVRGKVNILNIKTDNKLNVG